MFTGWRGNKTVDNRLVFNTVLGLYRIRVEAGAKALRGRAFMGLVLALVGTGAGGALVGHN
jgi:hypothetical protein